MIEGLTAKRPKACYFFTASLPTLFACFDYLFFLVFVMLHRLKIPQRQIYDLWFCAHKLYRPDFEAESQHVGVGAWIWVTLMYAHIHDFTHKQDYVVVLHLSAPSNRPLAVSPWVATQLPSLSPSPPPLPLVQSPGSAPTPYSTNCLSISPVPVNYQLLMNGSPYWAERRQGKVKERKEQA